MGNAQGGEVDGVLGQLEALERKVEAVHALQRQEVEALLHQQAERKARPKVDALGLFGALLEPGPAKVLVGPVVGHVGATAARVLLEVDRDAEVTLHLSLVDARCPAGRVVGTATAQCRARRPAAFALGDLPSGASFRFAFAGVTREDALARTGSFRTVVAERKLRVAGVCGDSPGCTAPGDDGWAFLRERVEAGALDAVLHVGGQVDLRGRFQRCQTMLERLGPVEAKEGAGAEAQRRVVERLVGEELREAYRYAWNLPEARAVLAHCGNLMIWSDLDMPTLPTRNTLARPEHEQFLALASLAPDVDVEVVRTIRYAPRLLVLAQQVFREYQRALWSSDAQLELFWGPDGSGNEEHALLELGAGVGVLLVDSRGAQFNPDGTATPWPTSPLISAHQLSAIRKALQESAGLSTLLVACDRPPVRLGAPAPSVEAAYDHWEANMESLAALLGMLFAWESEARIVIVCGTGPHDVAAETTLRSDDFPGREITQLASSTLTACYDAPRTHELGPLEGEIELPPTDQYLAGGAGFQAGALTRVAFQHKPVEPRDKTPGAPTPRKIPLVAVDASTVRARLVSTAVASEEATPTLLLGPVVGRVTHDSARVLVEVDLPGPISCVLEDQLTGRRIEQRRSLVPAKRAAVFEFDGCLASDRAYRVSFPGVASRGAGEPRAELHTMASPRLAIAAVQRALSVLLVHGDAPSSRLFAAEGRAATLWERAVQVRDWCKPFAPTATVHLGGQVDLRIVEDELRTAIRARSRGRPPCELDDGLREQIRAEVERAMRTAYRTMWALPEVAAAFASGSHLFCVSEADILEPPSFRECSDLAAWRPLVRQQAFRLACEYQQGLNGAATQGRDGESGAEEEEEEEEPQHCHFEGLHILGGSLAVLVLSALTPARISACHAANNAMASERLTSAQWARLDRALRVEAEHVQTLLVVSDAPLIADPPQDAVIKAADPGCHPRVRRAWSSFPEDCLRLVDLLFAWKAEKKGREALVAAADRDSSFQTVISHTDEDVRITLPQLCLAPITQALNPSLDALPFAMEGTLGTPETVGAKLVPPRYRFAHKAATLGNNAFAIVRAGCARDDGVCELRAHVVSADDPRDPDLRRIGVPETPAWLLGALVAGESTRKTRREQAHKAKGQSEAEAERAEAEREIKEAYPGMRFPEDEVEPAADEDPTAPPPAPTAEPEAAREDAPARRTLLADPHELAFKFLDFDATPFGAPVVRQVQTWHAVSGKEGKTELNEAAQTVYERHARGGAGVLYDAVPQAMVELFASPECPASVAAICVPQGLPAPGLELFVRMATQVALRRRLDAMEDRHDMTRALPFSQFYPTAIATGAVMVIGAPALRT